MGGGAGVALGVAALEVGELMGRAAHVVAVGAAEGTDETVNGVLVCLRLLVLVENWGAKLRSDFAPASDLILLLLALSLVLVASLDSVARPGSALSPAFMLAEEASSLVGSLLFVKDLPKIVDR